MECSLEITFYPLCDDWLDAIETVVRALEAAPDLVAEVGTTSTRLYGDYDQVMALVTRVMAPALAAAPGAFVLKVLGMDTREVSRPGT